MKISDLEQLRTLEGLIQRELQRLSDLRSAAGIHSASFDSMPHAPGPHDRIGEIVPDIVEQENVVMQRISEYRQRKAELVSFINHLPQLRLRLIFQLRFIDGLSWQAVADTIDGEETEYAVKQAAYRYLKRLEGIKREQEKE